MVIYEILTRVDPPARKLKDCYAFKADDFKSKLPSEIPDKLWELLCDCVRTIAPPSSTAFKPNSSFPGGNYPGRSTGFQDHSYQDQGDL